ncbi:MAG TPA: CPBP family intramembrane glutamic endopeptidase [Gemmatimonadales bacterium]|jgi:membrane protease YdiL (CAAX protease family)|nr:CPBP family intramembrane glutamic endopeptidase [Gemmatimonadales bacterium]
MNPRYSSRQLALAKVLAVLLIGLVWGPFLAKTPDKRGTMILGAIVLVGLVAVFYESVARLLALAIGRFAPPKPEEPEAFQPTGSLAVPVTVGDTAALFGWFLAAQFVVWVAAGVVAAVRAQELGDVAVQLEMVNVVPVALPISMATSGVVLLLALGRWRERLGPVTFDWVVAASRGSSRNLLLGAGVGVTLGVAIVLVGHVLEAKPTGTPNLLIQAMAKPGVGRWSFAVTAAALAPPLEEVLFRGALLGGLREAWGVPRAAVVTGLIFWLLHAPEWIHYWPAALGIGLLTAVLTMLRLKSASLGPPIAAHCAYNLVLVGILLAT